MSTITTDKKVSIIVPAYNVEQYIGRCLDSILAQTYGNLEILIVDDGSTDGTGSIIDEYAAKDNRIRVIHRENAGVASARNAALHLASGDYIGFVDSDDKITQDMFGEMVRACESRDARIAVCTYRQCGEGAEKIDPSGETFVLTREDALDAFVCEDRPYHIYYAVWNKLFRREILKDLFFEDGRESEDIMFSTVALSRADRIVFVDKALYEYTLSRSDSIMNSRLHQRRFRDEIPFMKEQIAYFQEKDMSLLSEKAYYHFCRRMLFYYIDFLKKRMGRSASEIHRMVKKDRVQIKELYKHDFVKFGDRVRMFLFQYVPLVYYLLVILYDLLIIPVRNFRR